MPNYQNGKVYKIVNNENNEIYVGSTAIKYLSNRMGQHRSKYRLWKAGKESKISSCDMFEKCGLENCRVILIENYPCNSKDALRAREDYWIKNTPNCINTKGAIKDFERKKENESIYRQGEKHKTYQREYKKSSKYKEYEKKHKSQIFNCCCGGRTMIDHKLRHERSSKHKEYIWKNAEENYLFKLDL